MQTIDQRQLHFSDAILASLAGGETVAVRADSEVIAFIVPASPRGELRPCGLAKGEFTVPADFDDPTSEIEAVFYGQ